MTTLRYYRGRDIGKVVIFDFPSNVQDTPREELERSFSNCLSEKQDVQNRTATDEIEILFFTDSLAKIREGRPLISVQYSK